MRTTIVLIVLAAMMMLTTLASAQTPQYWRGWNEAANLWNTGVYQCTWTAVMTNFRPAVESQIVQNFCVTTYQAYWDAATYTAACQQGAREYVESQANSCAGDPQECQDLGNMAAGDVIASLCPAPVQVTFAAAPFHVVFPEYCRQIGISTCESTVVSQLPGLMPCANFPGWQSYYIIENECESAVNALIGR